MSTREPKGEAVLVAQLRALLRRGCFLPAARELALRMLEIHERRMTR